MLHGLTASYEIELAPLGAHLQAHDFCTFAPFYGGFPFLPLIGGLKSADSSSKEIAKYITMVKEKTGADKVDIIGHSEGAFMTLYVPKFFPEISSIAQRLVAIAPPTRGSTVAGWYTLLGPGFTSLAKLIRPFCAFCSDDEPNSKPVLALNKGPIVQQGNTLTVIASRNDESITPTTTAFVHEDGVTNIYVQDYCPADFTGHIGEGYDPNVAELVRNSLEDQIGRHFKCEYIQLPI